MKPEWPLETDRLALRPYEEADLDALHELLADVEVVRWLYGGPATREEATEKLEQRLARRELTETSGLAAAVTLRDGGDYVGDLGLWNTSVDDRGVELAYMILPRHERTFVENEFVEGEWGSEAFYAILEREWPR